MTARFVEILLIYVTTFSSAGELSRDQNSQLLQFWPKTVLDALTRKMDWEVTPMIENEKRKRDMHYNWMDFDKCIWSQST